MSDIFAAFSSLMVAVGIPIILVILFIVLRVYRYENLKDQYEKSSKEDRDYHPGPIYYIPREEPSREYYTLKSQDRPSKEELEYERYKEKMKDPEFAEMIEEMSKPVSCKKESVKVHMAPNMDLSKELDEMD